MLPEMDILKTNKHRHSTPLERSPSIVKRTLEHKIEMENKDHDDTWNSCCFQLDRRAVEYFTQVGIIAFTSGFSIYQLVSLKSCEGQQAYMGLLTLMIGILCPGPKFGTSPKKP